MRILYITHGLPVGGAESLVVSYLLKLKERGEEVALIEMSHYDSFLSRRVEECGIPTYTIVRNNLLDRLLNRLFPSSFIDRCNKAIKSFDPDVIHFQTVFRYMESLNFPMEKSVFTFHARVDRCFNIGAYVRPLFERLSRAGLRFVAISSKVEKDIQDYFPSAKIIRIPNGVDLNGIRNKQKNKKEIREELGIPVEAFVIGQVGRFNKVKNHSFTLDVFRVIAKRNEKALLALVGDGSNEEREIIEKKVREYGLRGKVIMLGLRDDAPQLMCGFDVLIHPSFSESFSLTLIEAQANGVRCVASDEIPNEVICNSNSTQLSLDDTAEKWADVIMDNTLRKRTSDLNQFDIEKVIDKHLELYKSLNINH